jgi:hypothetical protein
VLRVSASAETAKLTIKFLQHSSGGGDAAAQKLKEMFASGQFHTLFGRIMSSMCGPRTLTRSLLSRLFFIPILNIAAHAMLSPAPAGCTEAKRPTRS